MTLRSYSRAEVMRRLFNAPLQVLPDTAAIVMGAVGGRYDVSQLFMAAEGRTLQLGELEALAATERTEILSRAGVDQIAPKAAAGELMRVIEGVAHIEVRGELVAENGIGPVSGFTGYDGIRAQVLSADADAGVRGLLMDINSPGGEVDSLYECVGALMARRGTKPMRAVIRGTGASAAYALAACADEVTVHPLGIAGSIGTIAMHADFSGQLAQEGIKVTLIMAGAHKADGNPFEPLPDDVRDEIAAMVNVANDQFLNHVAAARAMSVDAVRAQQARIYRGEDAVSAGLADKVMSWADSIEEFRAAVNSPTMGGGNSSRTARPAPGARSQENAMDPNANAPAAEQPEFSQTTQDAAVTAAVAADRQRVGELIELDASSKVSPELSSAIKDGTSAGGFAIAMARASKQQREDALSGARQDAAKPEELPEARRDAGAGGGSQKVNRGEAAVKRFAGQHRGLPKTS